MTLVEKFHMTLTGMKKRVGVLEQAGLVITEKVGGVWTWKVGLRGLEKEAGCIERYRQLLGCTLRRAEQACRGIEQKEKAHAQKKRDSEIKSTKYGRTMKRKSERELSRDSNLQRRIPPGAFSKADHPVSASRSSALNAPYLLTSDGPSVADDQLARVDLPAFRLRDAATRMDAN